ncbi:MAG: NUDIX domain-containing protein, partial [Crenarchaeota archaeon]|nr:NUDIX domain-containing protein [Thermoproteota archaeon]
VLVKGNKILLSRRYNTGFHDGEYSFPAGHLKSNETLIQALIREAKEETGIELTPEDLRLVHVMHRKEPNENRVNFFFAAEKWGGEPEIMEPHKCDDLKWFGFSNLPDNTIPYIRQAIICALQKIFYSEHGW